MCPLHPEAPSHLPPHSITLGCHRAPVLGALCHTSNSHWLSILHMYVYIYIYLHIHIYMFQCYSLKSSHPFLLPVSPEVCFLPLCLLCCHADRIINTIFLDSIHYLYSIQMH